VRRIKPKLFEELADILDEREKILIKGNIFGMLTNMDLKYLNFLGELSVLHRLKKTLPIKLIATKTPLDIPCLRKYSNVRRHLKAS